MPDTVAAIPADVVANLTPETRATYITQMVEAGHKLADVEASLAAPMQRGAIDPNGRAYSTAEQADAAVAASRKSAEDRVRASLAEHAKTPEGDDYQLNLKDHAQGVDITTLVRTASELKSAFSAAKIPAQLAQPLADALLSSERAVAALKPNQRSQWIAEQRSMLSRLPGGIEGQLKDAAIATAAIPDATRNAWLKSGRLESMQAIVFLSHAGKAITARALAQAK